MALFNKNKMAALSPTTPPQGFKGKKKEPKKNMDKKDKSKPLASGFMAAFGKK